MTVASGPVLALAGCDLQRDRREQPAPDPTEVSVRQAISDARALRAGALAAARAEPAHRALLTAVAGVHEAHLAALGADPSTSATPSEPTASATASSVTAAASTAGATAVSATATASSVTPGGGSAVPTPATGSGSSPVPTGSAGSGAATPPASGGSGAASPSAPPASATLQLAAEWGAAQVALRDAAEEVPGLALLLTRIAAARAVNADLLARAVRRADLPALTPAAEPAAGDTPSGTSSGTSSAASGTSSAVSGTSSAVSGSSSGSGPTSSATAAAPATSPAPATTAAPATSPATAPPPPAAGSAATGSPGPPGAPAERTLDRLLAGEHAAVFAYPLVIARSRGAAERRARTLWGAHLLERDRLTARLLATGVRPTPAAPGYQLGTVRTAAQAERLAVRVERGLVRLAGDVVSAADGDARSVGAGLLVRSARRQAGWTRRPDALTGAITTQPASTASTARA